ncbi:MAG: LON peptidase substrate-binding domain-containing protein [Acidimicrobiales bacterium]
MRRLPVFPLATVLVPGAVLPLHIFEPRYRQLMSELTGTSGAPGEFGVVLIERGSEVGGGEVRRRVGTIARLVGQEELADGRWVAVAVGTRPFRVVEWLPDDPYPVALVDEVTDDPVQVVAGDLSEAARQVRRSLALAAELGYDVAPVALALSDDPVEALWQLCAAVPLGPLDKQRLLEVASAPARCQALTAEAAELASVLAQRLATG